ncbi:MAG: MetQ/NlpA family ABC transporter substrate-binding protein [Clostridia bacterium]|nr:MetQ/NlpA family ABC transporter substrate-binding protein [Clostridia bacterium]
MKKTLKRILSLTLAAVLLVGAFAFTSCGANNDKVGKETYDKIVDAFQTAPVAVYMLEKYKEAYFPAFEYEDLGVDPAAFVEEIDNYKSSKDDKIVVKVGVCGSSNQHWNAVQKVLDDQNAGIYIELVEFTAYNLPNQALANGEIHLNSFQHKAYLQKEMDAQGYDLTVVGDTLIAPLSLYSNKVDTLDELKALATDTNKIKIGIPDDATNQARAIKLLESAGLIEVDPAAGYNPEMKHITGYLYNVEIIPTTADTLPSLLDDYAACTINGTYATQIGLIPSQDALIIESQGTDGNNPYVNIIVARTEDLAE